MSSCDQKLKENQKNKNKETDEHEKSRI